jgi:transcriptional regulator with XRE-family HTH domain
MSGPPLDSSKREFTADLEIAHRLRGAREALGFSQEEVSEAVGISRSGISAIEAAQRKVSVSELRLFSKLYRVSYEYLLEGAHQREPNEVVTALFRTTLALSDPDVRQVLRFAEFLKQSGPPPKASKDPE